MEIDIPMKRVRVSDILSTYDTDFLEKHNFFNIGKTSYDLLAFKHIMFTAIVKTKYGYMAVDYQDYITYVGDRVWSVTRNGNR